LERKDAKGREGPQRRSRSSVSADRQGGGQEVLKRCVERGRPDDSCDNPARSMVPPLPVPLPQGERERIVLPVSSSRCGVSTAQHHKPLSPGGTNLPGLGATFRAPVPGNGAGGALSETRMAELRADWNGRRSARRAEGM